MNTNLESGVVVVTDLGYQIEQEFLLGQTVPWPKPLTFKLAYDASLDFYLPRNPDGTFPDTPGYVNGIKVPNPALTQITNPIVDPATGLPFVGTLFSVLRDVTVPNRLNIRLKKRWDQYNLNTVANVIGLYDEAGNLFAICHSREMQWFQGEYLTYTLSVEILQPTALESINKGDFDRMIEADARMVLVAETVAATQREMVPVKHQYRIGTQAQVNILEATHLVADLPTLSGKVAVMPGTHLLAGNLVMPNDLELDFAPGASLDLASLYSLTFGGKLKGRLKVVNAAAGSVIPSVSAFKLESDSITCLNMTGLTGVVEHNQQLFLGQAATLDKEVIRRGDDTELGTLTLRGDLLFLGNATQITPQQVLAVDNLITLNSGEVGNGVTAGEAGVEVDRGPTWAKYKFIFDETDDAFKIGEVGGLQKVATRQDAPVLKGIAIWNSTTSRFDTYAGFTYDDTTRKITLLGANSGSFEIYVDAGGNPQLIGSSTGSVVFGNSGGGGFELWAGGALALGIDGNQNVSIPNGKLTLAQDPVDNLEAATKQYADAQIPVGSIMAWNPGYYTDGSNAGFAASLLASNDVAGANAYLAANNPKWRVCDGSAPNLASSPIWNAAGRYLPNLTDSRFLMGSTGAGGVGGLNSQTNLLTHGHGLTGGVSNLSGGNSGNQSATHTHGFSWTDNKLYSIYSAQNVGGSTDTGAMYYGSGLTNFEVRSGYWSGSDTNYFSMGFITQQNSPSGTTGTESTNHSHNIDHGHGHSLAVSNYNGVSSLENRPLYLGTIFIIKVLP